MNTEYNVYFFENFIEKYAQSTGKAVAYIRTYGWNHGKDIDKINESMQVYSEILPLDMMTVMRNSEFVFVEIDDIEQAIALFQDNFPENQEDCIPEYYVHFSLYNNLGQLILSN
jgi:hypothetical protein